MLGYALRRLVLAVPLLIGITLISFFVIHLAPGEPTDLGTGDTPVQSDREVRERLRQMYGLDKPLHVQYVNWLTRLVRLDFGRSFSPDARPVLQKIGERRAISSCRSWSRPSAGSPGFRATCDSRCSRSCGRTTSSPRGPRVSPRAW